MNLTLTLLLCLLAVLPVPSLILGACLALWIQDRGRVLRGPGVADLPPSLVGLIREAAGLGTAPKAGKDKDLAAADGGKVPDNQRFPHGFVPMPAPKIDFRIKTPAPGGVGLDEKDE